MPADHDLGYKLLFAHPELVRELVSGFTAFRWLDGIDADAFERVNPDYVSERFSERRDDIVWRVKLGETWLYIYILLEFQSGVDRWMALRMQVYIGLLYQDLVKRHEYSPEAMLPPVLPLVLYNGRAAWHAELELASMIMDTPDGLAQFQASQRYCLIDQRRIDKAALERSDDVLALLFRLELATAPEVLREVVALLSAWLQQDAQSPLRRAIRLWVQHQFVWQCADQGMTICVNSGESDSMSDVKEFDNFGEMLVYHGRQQGKAEGERAALLRIVSKRFGQVPPAIAARIERAEPAETEAWIDRALDADNLQAIFGE